jgi:hypothetical protein
MQQKELLTATVAGLAAACRRAGRPDAAQALEDRTEEEWVQCLHDNWQCATAAWSADLVLGGLFWWGDTAEGLRYWAEVQARLNGFPFWLPEMSSSD